MNKKSIFEMFRLNFMSRLYIRILVITFTILVLFLKLKALFLDTSKKKNQTNPFQMFIFFQKTMKAHLVI